MVSDYLILLRTAWLGALWCCTYLVRPVLESQGYFPHHGIAVMDWAVGVGFVIGLMMTGLALWRRVFDVRSRATQVMSLMMVLSLGYFGLDPWWKLQMMLMHALSLLGVLWLLMAPKTVV